MRALASLIVVLLGAGPPSSLAAGQHSSLAAGQHPSLAAGQAEQPVELGRVRFLRSLDEGLARAGRESKPAFVLFQEVPG